MSYDNFKDGYCPTKYGKVYYKIFGEKSENLPLIVVHGGPGGLHNYLLPISELANSRQVIFYDQLGCDKSDEINDKCKLKLENFVDELKELINHLKIEKCYLLGQSWGTMVVSEFIAENPGIAQKAILSSPFLNAKLFAKDAREYFDELDIADKEAILKSEKTGNYDTEEYQNAMGSFYSKFVCRLNPFPDYVNDSFGNLSTFVYYNMWGVSEFTISGSLQNKDITPNLSKIDIPILITVGEFDEVKPQTAKYYSTFFKDCKIEILKDASHLHHCEKIEEYNLILMEFLK